MSDTLTKIVKNARVIDIHSGVEYNEDGYLINRLDEFSRPTTEFYWISREDGMYYVDLCMNENSYSAPYWDDGAIRIYGMNGTREVMEFLPDVLNYCGH